MNLKKCFLCIAVFCLLGNVSTVKAFSDLDSTHWAYDTIMKMTENGILSGYNDGTFKPNNFINKAEFATIISKVYDLENNNDKMKVNFIDVDNNHWAKNYIYSLAAFTEYRWEQQLEFEPSKLLTREEALAMIVWVNGLHNENLTFYIDRDNLELNDNNYRVSTGGSGDPNIDYDETENILQRFSDSSKIEYISEVVSGVKNGFMSGNSNGTFNPKGNLTRAEFSALINNIMTSNNNPKVKAEYKVNVTVDNLKDYTVSGNYKQGDMVSFMIPKKEFEYVRVTFENGPIMRQINPPTYENGMFCISFVMPDNNVDLDIVFSKEAYVVRTYPEAGATDIGDEFYVEVEFSDSNYLCDLNHNDSLGNRRFLNQQQLKNLECAQFDNIDVYYDKSAGAANFELIDENGQVIEPIKSELLGDWNKIRKTYSNAKYKVANVKVTNNSNDDYNFNFYYGDEVESNEDNKNEDNVNNNALAEFTGTFLYQGFVDLMTDEFEKYEYSYFIERAGTKASPGYWYKPISSKIEVEGDGSKLGTISDSATHACIRRVGEKDYTIIQIRKEEPNFYIDYDNQCVNLDDDTYVYAFRYIYKDGTSYDEGDYGYKNRLHIMVATKYDNVTEKIDLSKVFDKIKNDENLEKVNMIIWKPRMGAGKGILNSSYPQELVIEKAKVNSGKENNVKYSLTVNPGNKVYTGISGSKVTVEVPKVTVKLNYQNNRGIKSKSATFVNWEKNGRGLFSYGNDNTYAENIELNKNSDLFFQFLNWDTKLNGKYSVELPKLADREGYSFNGWYTEDYLGSKVISLIQPGIYTFSPTKTSVTLYAHWSEK